MSLTRLQVSEINSCVIQDITERIVVPLAKPVSNKVVLENLYQKVDSKLQQLGRNMQLLEDKLDKLEQYSSRNNLKTFGIKEEDKRM